MMDFAASRLSVGAYAMTEKEDMPGGPESRMREGNEREGRITKGAEFRIELCDCTGVKPGTSARGEDDDDP
jgi:hypothetical protein